MLVTSVLRGPQQKDLTPPMGVSVLLVSTAHLVHPCQSHVCQEHTTMQVVKQHVWTAQQVFTAVEILPPP